MRSPSSSLLMMMYVAIVWAHLDMPPPSPGAPTLYDFYLDPTVEAWATSEDDEDNNFGWQTNFRKR